MGKLGNYDVSLLRSLTQLPSDDGVDPVNMVYCVGAVGAALNQMEGV